MGDGAVASVEGRVPPHDLDAEAAVISAVLVDPLALDKVLPGLQPEHFYSEAHRQIFDACLAVVKRRDPLDVTTCAMELKARERIQQVGGMGYLTEVLNAAPFVANVGAYANRVTKLYRVRTMIATCQRVAATGYVDYGDPDAYLEQGEQAVYAVTRDTAVSDLEKLGGVLKVAFGELVEAAKRGLAITGIPTGFDRYDRLTAGLHEGDLTIIAARPGMGKSAFALNVATNVASKRFVGATEYEAIGVCVFSLEMPKEQCATRMMCCEAKVDLQKIRSPGFLSPKDWDRMTNVAAELGARPIWIDDTPILTPVALRAKVRRKQAELDAAPKDGKPRVRVGLVIVDYLQLMRGNENTDNREQEVGSVSRELKAIAKELRVPVIALAQLNRQSEIRSEKNRRPQLSDLRESGSIEQDADNICFIYRDDYYNKDSTERAIAELLLSKQRSGPTGVAKVRFDREYTRFDNLAEGEYVEDE